MKIINPSRPPRQPLGVDQILDQEIERLQNEIGVKERIVIPLPLHLKRQYLSVLENLVEARAERKNIQEEAQLQLSLRARDFPRFNELPKELRIKIWGYASASHTKPRIHCLKIVDSRSSRGASFISNQPVSPILHANHESRSCYHFETHPTFAFETYINFDTDIVYIPGFGNGHSVFRKFLYLKDVAKIQKLAMRKTSFSIPRERPYFSNQLEMRKYFPDWRQVILIFDDQRPEEEIWKDTSVTFRELSAKEKRKPAERSHIRGHCRVMNNMMAQMKEETVDYRFGCLERGADYVDSQQTFLTAELEMEYLSLKLSRIVR